MKKQTPSINRWPGLLARAFTLTELLIVLVILTVLMTMLAPSLTKAIGTARRRACAGNQASIIKGAGQYALSDRRKCLPTIFKKNDPNQNQGYNNWGDMIKGQPGCLWLLVKEKQVDRSAFLCPEAETNRSWTAPALDDKNFTYTSISTSPLQDISTLSFSFISMTYRVGSWDAQLADQMSMDLVPGTLVVLADQNPRCTFGKTGALTAYDANAPNGTNRYTRRNSLNHKREGQNMTRWDGSVLWGREPDDQAINDIYSSSDTAKEIDGKRKEMADPFLLP